MLIIVRLVTYAPVSVWGTPVRVEGRKEKKRGSWESFNMLSLLFQMQGFASQSADADKRKLISHRHQRTERHWCLRKWFNKKKKDPAYKRFCSLTSISIKQHQISLLLAIRPK